MRKWGGLLALASVLMVSVGCGMMYRAPVIPPIGMLYSGYKAPLTTEFNGQPVATKSGEAESMSILGLIAVGDCSLQTAARDGGLSNIQYCDYAYLNVLGIYQGFTLTAYGQ